MPVAILLLLGVCIYVKDQASDTPHWSHSKPNLTTADQNLTYYYRDTNGRTLITPWTAEVDRSNPHPEYPRPQMQRRAWQSLNGPWGFDCTGLTGVAPNLNRTLKQTISVPFPVESYLSDVFRADSSTARMWYRRSFTVPGDWADSRILLHFGAVDWQTTVTVNGRKLGTHTGGYDKFTFDITAAVAGHANGHEHEVLVEVFDVTEFAHAPVGKQRMHPPRRPSSIFYTSNSGIWQTVWLEPVPTAFIERLDLVPDVDRSHLSITVQGNAAAKGLKVVVNASADGHPAGSASGFVGEKFTMAVPEAHLWSPDDPFLYDLDVVLLGGQNAEGVLITAESIPEFRSSSSSQAHSGSASGLTESDISSLLPDTADPSGRRLLAKDSRSSRAASAAVTEDPAVVDGAIFDTVIEDQVDHVRAYFGMRKISLGRIANEKALRPLLNDKFIFHMGMLDQGYWPDGIYTAPTDAALKYDIEASKAMGFNMLRKHIKVEPDRWYYWADHLGILVWQDMPAMFWEDARQPMPTQQEKDQYESEFKRMIEEHFSFPSIVMYVVFNEGWGQYETERVTKYVKSLDPSRLYNPASGWIDAAVGDIIDMHKYVGPGAFNPTSSRASVLGEYGGLGLKVESHQWIPDDSFSYEMQANPGQLLTRYSGLIAQISALMAAPEFSLSAAVYTELTDVEAEVNGMLTYDRQVMKMDEASLHKVHTDLLDASRQLNDASAPSTLDQKQLKKAIESMMAPNKGEEGYAAPQTELIEQARRAQIPLSQVVMPFGQQQQGRGLSPLATMSQQPDTFDAATKAAGHKVAGVIHAIWRFLGRSSP